MRFAIAIPQSVADGAFDPAAFRAYLTRAEQLGFESVWTMEQTIGTSPYLNPVEVMTYAAACNDRLRLGCVVFVSTLHSPLHLAKSISTLDQLSRGRLEVGVGFGGPRMFSAFGVPADSALARFTEGLQLMKACWTQERIDFEGRFWQVDKVGMEPKPFQKPYPPLWFGARHPNALRRAVKHGDGFFGAGSSTTAQFTEQVQVVRAALNEAGRDDFRIAKRVYVAVDDDTARAERRVTEALDRFYGTAGQLTPVAVYGPADACVAGLREVIDAGAEMVLLNPLFDDAEQMERLAAEVVPHLS